jgi:hypothetical protein
MDVVPSDMIAQIHQGERIIPAADNSRIIDAVNGGARDGGNGGGDTHVHFRNSWNVKAHDARGVRDFLMSGEAQAAIVDSVSLAFRKGIRPK